MPAQPIAAAADVQPMHPAQPTPEHGNDLGKMFGGFLSCSIGSITVNVNPTCLTVTHRASGVEDEFDNIMQEVDF